LRSVELAISTPLSLSSSVFLGTLDAIAAIVSILAAVAAVIAVAVADGCAFTAPVQPLLPAGFAVVASIGSCDDGHVFVVFAAAIVAAVADVIAATVADGCAFTAPVHTLLPTGFAVVVAIVVDCDIVFLFFFFIVRGSSTIIIFFCPPKEDEDENKGVVSRPADGFDLPSLLRAVGFNQFLMLACPALSGTCCCCC
jgi:hypothetical protein